MKLLKTLRNLLEFVSFFKRTLQAFTCYHHWTEVSYFKKKKKSFEELTIWVNIKEDRITVKELPEGYLYDKAEDPERKWPEKKIAADDLFISVVVYVVLPMKLVLFICFVYYQFSDNIFTYWFATLSYPLLFHAEVHWFIR